MLLSGICNILETCPPKSLRDLQVKRKYLQPPQNSAVYVSLSSVFNCQRTEMQSQFRSTESPCTDGIVCFSLWQVFVKNDAFPGIPQERTTLSPAACRPRWWPVYRCNPSRLSTGNRQFCIFFLRPCLPPLSQAPSQPSLGGKTNTSTTCFQRRRPASGWHCVWSCASRDRMDLRRQPWPCPGLTIRFEPRPTDAS